VRSRYHCSSGKAISITYSECVSAVSVIQHIKRMRRIILYFARPALPSFPTLSHKLEDIRKKNLLNVKRVLTFTALASYRLGR